jgi:hypothetical protein
MCLECGEPILSNSYRGQEVNLYLLKEGKVIQEMQGQYDSYGKVFTSLNYRTGSSEWWMVWDTAVDLHFNDDKTSGFAAVHTDCLKEGFVPTIISDDDPYQGWGYNEGELIVGNYYEWYDKDEDDDDE